MAENTVLQQYNELDEARDIELKKKAQRKSRMKESAFGMALLCPYIIVFVLFSIVPMVMGIVFSFMQYNPYNPADSHFIGLQNYVNMFNLDIAISKEFWSSFLTMFMYVAIGTPLAIVVPFFLAYFISMEPPGYKFFRAVLYFPSVVSITIMGIIFGNMFASDSSGLINSLIGKNISWLSGTPFKDDALRWLVIFIATMWWCNGSNFIIFTAAFKNVPKSLYEACEMDGGKKWKKIIYVTIPNIMPTVNICLFNILIGYLGLYGQVITLNDYTNSDIMVSPIMFIQNYLSDFSYARLTGYVSSCAVVFGIIVAFFSTIQRMAMSEHRRKPVYTAACDDFIDTKHMLEKLNINGLAEDNGGAL